LSILIAFRTPKRSRTYSVSKITTKIGRLRAHDSAILFSPLTLPIFRAKQTIRHETERTAKSSRGDPDGEELILNGRAVIMRYADENRAYASSRLRRSSFDDASGQNDWFCSHCNARNFARRIQCFKCTAPRATHENLAPANEKYDNAVVVAPIRASTNEAAVESVFRQFAPVREVNLMRDTSTGLSRGFCIVTFFTDEQARYCARAAAEMIARGNALVVDGANVSVHIRGSSAPTTSPLQAVQGHYDDGVTSTFAPTESGANDAAATSTATVAAVAMMPRAFKWPPPFEDAGACYTFDVTTGLYFESSTNDFYYNSDRKLYYCISKQTYYTYDCESKTFSETTTAEESNIDDVWRAVFDEASQRHYYFNSATQETTWEMPASLKSEAHAKKELPIGQTKKEVAESEARPFKIAFKSSTPRKRAASIGFENATLKTLANPVACFSETHEDTNASADKEAERRVIEMQMHRSQGLSIHQERIERQRLVKASSMRQQKAALEVRSKIQSAASSSTDTSASSSIATPKTRTSSTKSKSICWVCRRGFKTLAMLKKHERESALHKKNLELQTKASYVDRAAERRRKYGQSDVPVHDVTSGRSGFAVDVPEKKKVRVRREHHRLNSGAAAQRSLASAKPIAEDNRGHAMLKKLGWKQGSGLGKRGDGITEPIQVARGGTIRNGKRGVGLLKKGGAFSKHR